MKITVFYNDDPVNFMENLFDEYTLWNNNVINVYKPFGAFKNFKLSYLPLSRQFNKYFNNDIVKGFLEEIGENSYIIGVIYYNENGTYDILPCFTESGSENEEEDVLIKRMMNEELFTNTLPLIIDNYVFKDQNIHLFEQKVEKIKCGEIFIKERNVKKNKFEKCGVIIHSKNLENLRKFINKWRSIRHNLSNLSERKYMIDLGIIKVKSIFKCLHHPPSLHPTHPQDLPHP